MCYSVVSRSIVGENIKLFTVKSVDVRIYLSNSILLLFIVTILSSSSTDFKINPSRANAWHLSVGGKMECGHLSECPYQNNEVRLRIRIARGDIINSLFDSWGVRINKAKYAGWSDILTNVIWLQRHQSLSLISPADVVIDNPNVQMTRVRYGYLIGTVMMMYLLQFNREPSLKSSKWLTFRRTFFKSF